MKTRLRSTLICTFLLLFILTISGGFYLQWYALQAKGNERGKDIEASYSFMHARYPFLQEWTDSLMQREAIKDTFLYVKEGRDSVKLHAIYIYGDTLTLNTAVVIHGYTDNAIRMLHIAYLYHHDLRYNVLLPDLRYSGQSEGTHIQMGWKDRHDVMQWMELADRMFSRSSESNDSISHTRMVVHGISMGAATTMCISGEEQPDYVNCYIEDCGYTSVWDEYSGELKKQFHLPEFPLLYVASGMTFLRYDWHFKEASPLSQVRKCTRPMLFIHGDQDTFVPTWMGDSLYAAKPGIKEYWRVPGVAHAEAYLKYPKEYTQRVKKFTETYNLPTDIRIFPHQ